MFKLPQSPPALGSEMSGDEYRISRCRKHHLLDYDSCVDAELAAIGRVGGHRQYR